MNGVLFWWEEVKGQSKMSYSVPINSPQPKDTQKLENSHIQEAGVREFGLKQLSIVAK